ncbi:hypothetical protein BGZ94_001202 [Podila epigama]|nr:hypothetical protein BGZ94_001202 [Podila epigama]
MFKKRGAPKAPKVTAPPVTQTLDDEDLTSPIITVSIPKDALDQQDPPPYRSHPHSNSSSRRSSIDSKQQTQPHMPWKPWNPQKVETTTTTTPPTDAQKTAATTVAATTTTTTTTISARRTGNSTTEASPPVPVEAQLWNADLPETSPLSPAGPRFIPAIAGAGTPSGAKKMNFGGSRKSFDGHGSTSASTGFKGFGHVSATSSTPSLANGQASSQSSPQSRSQQGHLTFSKPSLSTSSSSPSMTLTDTNNSNSSRRTSKSTHSLRTLSESTSGALPVTKASSTVNDTHHTIGFESNRHHQNQHHSNGSVYASQFQGHEGTLKKKGFRSMSEDEKTLSGSITGERGSGFMLNGRGETDSFGADYDDDDYKKKTRRSFSNGAQGHITDDFGWIFHAPKQLLRSRLFWLGHQRRRVHPAIRLIILLFLAGSVCFTTFQLIFHHDTVVDDNRKAALRKKIGEQAKNLRLGDYIPNNAIPQRPMSVFDVEAQNYSAHQWEFETYDIQGSKLVAKVAEDYMLSKAFGSVMQPTKVIPFYFRASFRDENDDDDFHADDEIEGEHDGGNGKKPVEIDKSQVTITTIITPDRYRVFLKLVKQYRGPISVATHIPKGADQDKHFQELNQFFHDHTILRKYVDLHVIVDGIDLQLNMWRNVARMFARTDYFMMLDVDFHIPSSLKNHLHDDPRMQELLASGAALVIPAFEYKVEKDPKDSKYFPDTKAALIPLLEKGHIHVFHDSFPPGHAATDTPRWMKMSSHSALGDKRYGDYRNGNELSREDYLKMEAEGEMPYKVTKFEPKYEPYIVLKKDGTPWCDERFVGYGANKAACLFEIYISGVDFWVMPQDFLIHQYHDYPTQNRKNGRILNKQLFVHFQQEICYRTLRRMIWTGEWYTSKADNLRQQCKVFDEFLKTADQLAREFEEEHPGSLNKAPVFVAHGQKQPRFYMTGLRDAASSSSSGSSSLKVVMADRGPQPPGVGGVGGIGQGGGGFGEGIGGGSFRPGGEGLDSQDPSHKIRPKGRIWGGIQTRTYYVPPPEEEDERLFDSQVGGSNGDDHQAGLDDEHKQGQGQEQGEEQKPGYEHQQPPLSSPPQAQLPQQQQPPQQQYGVGSSSNTQLSGSKLDKFRQGIIEKDDEDDFKFAFPKEGEFEPLDQKRERFRQLHEAWLDRGPAILDPATGTDAAAAEALAKNDPKRRPFFRKPGETFEEAARRLEQYILHPESSSSSS